MSSIVKKEISVKDNVDYSKAQRKVFEVLKGRKFIVKKVISGSGLLCDCCGKYSRVNKSLFVEVENDKKEVKRIAAGCLKVYFSIELKGSSGSGRIGSITL